MLGDETILQALSAVKVSTPRDLSIMGRNPDILLRVIEHQLNNEEQWDSLKNKVFCSILTDVPYIVFILTCFFACCG